MISTPTWGNQEGCHQKLDADQPVTQENGQKENQPTSQTTGDPKSYHSHSNGSCQNHSDEPRTPSKTETPRTEDTDEQSHSAETTVWIRCDVYDTGIGIPGMLCLS